MTSLPAKNAVGGIGIPQRLYPDLAFFDLSKDDHWDRFVKLASSLKFVHETPFLRIMRLLNSVPSLSIVLEREYVDRDFAPAFSSYYSRSLRDYSKRTIRFHFFKRLIRPHQLLRESISSNDYLGYCVLSPAEPITVGRSVISYPSQSSTDYLICQAEFPVNLCGLQLTARGAPFYQQDGRVSACATSAIWMAVKLLSTQVGNVRSPSPTEITEMASRYFLGEVGRAFPSEGLTVEQILWALHELQLDPIHITPKNVTEANERIYEYVESGIPVLLDLQYPDARHAVTVIGHTYDKDSFQQPPLPVFPNHLSSANWCPGFIINDDQMGPYIRMSLDSSTRTVYGHPLFAVKVDTSGLPSWEAAKLDSWYNEAFLRSIIVPLPPRVYLTAEYARRKAWRVFQLAVEILRRKGLSVSLPDQPVLRTFLLRSNDFKSTLIPTNISVSKDAQSKVRPGLCPELALLYRRTLMSPFVWLTELCDYTDKAGKDAHELRTIGEVILDPTSNVWTLDFITIHLQGLFMQMRPKDQDPVAAINAATEINGDAPWQATLRQPC